jgi:GNAT superfamily N-acetyltransferase
MSFENVLARAILGHSGAVARPGIEVRESGDQEFDAWFQAVAAGVAHPDEQGIPAHEVFPRDVIERAERDFDAAGVVRYVGLRDGVIAGGASLHMAEGVAQLAGAATVPEHRRQGVHSALLGARLADAADAGCDIAVVVTQPGSTSQRNVQRRGFDLLYARAVLVREPEPSAVRQHRD